MNLSISIFSSFVKSIFACSILCLLTLNLSAQGYKCAESTEFCPFGNQEAVMFPAGVDNPENQPENNYGCLGSTPNPAWYYIEIGIAGSIEIDLSNSENEDIDFALWGPFDNLNASLDSCGFLTYPIDCSYSISATELVNIDEALVGQVYLLLITNFSNEPTNISGIATGTGEIACCTLALGSGENCSISSEFAPYCWNTGLDLRLTNNGGTIPEDFCGTIESYRWASFEAFYSSSTIEISTQNCEQSINVKAQLFSSCSDLIPHSECLELNNNTAALLTNEIGNPNLDFNLGETYSLLIAGSATDTCTYRITTGEAIPFAPVFQQDTLEGTFSVCPNDILTYALPTATDVDTYEVIFSSIDAEITEITIDSFTVFYGEMAGDLCVNAINEVGTVSLCQEVMILPASTCETSVSTHSLNNSDSIPLQIIPNPVQNSLRFLTNDIGANWEIISTTGRILYNGNVNTETTLVSIQHLPTGSYFLRVKGKFLSVRKFVVEN